MRRYVLALLVLALLRSPPLLAAVTPPCAEKFRGLSLAQEQFERYFERLSKSTEKRMLKSLVNARNIQLRLMDQFEARKNLGDLNPADLAAFTKEVLTQMRIYGFRAKIDPKDAGKVLIEQLPKGHPLTDLFQRTHREPLGVNYVFDARADIQNEASGHQGGPDIFIKELKYGKVDKQVLLHEIGHRSSEMRSRTRQNHLYNSASLIFNEDAARTVIELPPGIYAREMVGDELSQHERDLRRLYSQSALTFVAGRTDELIPARKSKADLLSGIAKAMLARANYALEFLATTDTPLLMHGKAQIPVRAGNKNAGLLLYDLTASKAQLGLSENGMTTNDPALLKKTVVELAEFEKAEAERVLKYLEGLKQKSK